MIHFGVAGVSLGAGGLIYAANRPEQLIVGRLMPALDIALLRAPWIRNHGADALFALAVGALLAWWSTRNGVSGRVATVIGVVFLLLLECVGTFDPIDVVVELATFGMALAALRRQSPQT